MAETFTADYAVHPGETLKESLEASAMTQSDLAERTGLHRKTINGIVRGREPITHETAIEFEKVFRVPARFWVNLQANFDEATARLRERSRLAAYRDWIKECGIPYAELRKRGFVPDTRDPIDRLTAVLRFFGVSSPEAFEAVWEEYQADCAYRRSEKAAFRFGAVAAWLRQGELESQELVCAPFDKKKLNDSLEELRELALLPCEESRPLLVERCARLGIALLFVPGIARAPVYGATRWLTPAKAIVQLSLRGKDDGNFWFTFFHAVGHVLLHGKSRVFLEFENAVPTDEEEEADRFARDLLTPARR